MTLLYFRSVVEVLDMLLDFIETLEKKLDSVQNCSRAREQLSQMVSQDTIKLLPSYPNSY